MTQVDKQQIETAIQAYTDPYLQQNLLSAKSVSDIRTQGDSVAVDIELGFPAAGHHEALRKSVTDAVSGIASVRECVVNVTTKIAAHTVQRGVQRMKNIKNIIAVASGKGGVGKSTTAVNLALALQQEGAQVGILDADIYGPSQPRMLGLSGAPESKDGKSMEPKHKYGIQAMSIGFMIEEETPMIWRGPMVTQALDQLLTDTNWQNLDYLIIDLPPGTGDIQLSLSQKVPLSGAIIVTTPQDIALLDARKGLKMFEKVEVPILGIVENMSTHICSQCGHEEHVFGAGGGESMAAQYSVPFLGSLPLDIRIREQADGGEPTVVADPTSRISEIYREIARRTTASLSLQGKDYSAKFPKIVIQNT